MIYYFTRRFPAVGPAELQPQRINKAFTLRNMRLPGSMDSVKTSFPSSLPQPTGFASLVKNLAPAAIQMTYCATNALPFRVEWDSPRGPVRFYGISPDAAASEAMTALSRGSVAMPARESPVTEPSGNGAWAEAMRELIADLEPQRAPARPLLRIVRDQSVQR